MTERHDTRLIPLGTFLHRVFPAGTYPDDGRELSRLRLFHPRRGTAAVSLSTPIDWEAGDNPDRNWRMQLQGWTMFHPIMNVFDGLDSKVDAVEYFFDITSDWWRNYSDDDEAIVTSRTPDSYAWYDMSVGFRALILAFFADRIVAHDLSIGEARHQLLMDVISKHARHLRNPAVLYENNHGIFQAHGLRALAETTTYDGSEGDKAYAERTMGRLLDLQFDENGIHKEHSPHYHFFVLRTFESVRASGWYNSAPPSDNQA